MSGPKVVRIVTREEILAICKGHLGRLDRAIAHWTSEGKRTGELTDDDVAATLRRRDALAALIARDAFVDLQKGVPDEIAFLKTDLLRRQQVAIEKATLARKRERQGKENASTLLKELDARAINVPSGLREQLQSIADGSSSEQIELALMQGFNLLVPSVPAGLSAAQQALANQLKEPGADEGFDTWKAKQSVPSPLSHLFNRVDGQIAEAQTVLGPEVTAGYEKRLRSIEFEANEMRQSLLLDSLILDLSSDIAVARTQEVALVQLAEMSAELQAFDTVASVALRKTIAACDASTPSNRLAELAEECSALVSAELQRNAAQSRRDVILQGLARLGYEVHEGMTTAWAKDGRVVLRKPSLSGYGVEVGGQAETSRLQVRAVSLTRNRDPSRDKDIETIWCGDFARLQQLVAENGDNLLIERAMGVGEVPLKVIGEEAQTSESVIAMRKKS